MSGRRLMAWKLWRNLYCQNFPMEKYTFFPLDLSHCLRKLIEVL